MRRSTVSRLMLSTAAAGFALTLAACGYPGAGPRYSEFASNPTPREESLGRWAVERHNMHRYTDDTNARAFWDDFDRMLMHDRPSRLIVPPTPY